MINRMVHAFQRLVMADTIQDMHQSQHNKDQSINSFVFEDNKQMQRSQVKEVEESHKPAEIGKDSKKKQQNKKKKSRALKKLLDDDKKDFKSKTVKAKGKFFDRTI